MTSLGSEEAPAAGPVGRDGRHLPGEAGVWILIFGDMALFGVFFATYSFYRGRETAAFADAQRLLDVNLGVLNTLLLLTSSLFVVSGVRALRRGFGRPGSWLFVGAALCGVGFGLSKYVEYGEKLTVGITPTSGNFFMYYFILTGLHMFHVLIGIALLGYMIVQARQSRITVSTLRYVEGCGCFWHLVDLLWIVLFPLVYLVRT